MSIFVDVEKRLGSFTLRVQLAAQDEILALLGASGSGKSLTLKCIAGVEKPDRGRIVVDGRTLFDSEKHIDLCPQARRAGLLFQNYALFPNMTVADNIRAGARREKDKQKREALTNRIVERFGLTSMMKRLPRQLSGGEQQRVALARILVSSPDILLLDEPFSALDSHLRFKLEREVHETMRAFGKTVVLVSHDRDEVFRLSDSIAVLHNGRVETSGEKKAVFRNPETRAAAILTGCKNISRIERLDANHVRAIDWGMTLAVAQEPAERSYIGVRMHDLCLGEGENAFLCDVAQEIENPFSYTILLRPAAQSGTEPVGWETEKRIWREHRGAQLSVRLPKEKLVLLKE